MYILPDGRVMPCTIWQENPIGDFREQHFKDIWQDREYLRLRDELVTGNFREKCRKCCYML
jgi:radical SAM protein with 4Fe4S-binding SPASM domain